MAVEQPVTSERTEGPTPNGGVYAIAYFLDAKHNPTTKDKARHIEIHEFNGADGSIHRTLLTA